MASKRIVCLDDAMIPITQAGPLALAGNYSFDA